MNNKEKKGRKIFKLTPIKENLNHEDWRLSRWTKEVIVRHDDEANTRELVAISLLSVTPVTNPYSPSDDSSPWRNSQLTTCEEYRSKEYSPNGEPKVLFPTDDDLN